MRAIPIPDGVRRASGGRCVVIGEDDPTRDDVRPCEYVLTHSELYPGRYVYTALVALDDDERAAIAAGAHLSLTLDGAEVPWAIDVWPPVGRCE